MCGLIGWMIKAQNGFCHNEAQAFDELLYIDALRGEDSTGVAGLFNNGEMEIAKDATPAWEFVGTKEYQSLSSRLVSRGKAVIGHNRKKTVGKIDETTAHPFVLNNRYAFMHNGTLHSHKHLADTEVDSEALGIHITKCKGNPQEIEEALGSVYGAYACVWMDLELEKLYLLRNLERPLYLAETSGGYVFGSEAGMLAAACIRNRVVLKECQLIEEHTLYTFDLSGQGLALTKDKLEVKKATPPSTKETVSGGHMKVSALNGGVSKNAYKRFRKTIVGEPISFYLDDWVEKSYPVMDGNWLVFGKSDDIDKSHLVRGYLNTVAQSTLEYERKDRLHNAIVESADFDPKTKMIIITVKDIKLTPMSKPTKTSWPYPANIMQ